MLSQAKKSECDTAQPSKKSECGTAQPSWKIWVWHGSAKLKNLSVARLSQAKKSECGMAQPISWIAGFNVLNKQYASIFSASMFEQKVRNTILRKSLEPFTFSCSFFIITSVPSRSFSYFFINSASGSISLFNWMKHQENWIQNELENRIQNEKKTDRMNFDL